VFGARDVAETYRSLKALERTASTSRVLNLAALSLKHADNPEHTLRPFFTAPALNASVILKHRLRSNEAEYVHSANRTATKLIVPFERSDLALGGRSVFVGERGWVECLQELAGKGCDLARDAGVLEAMDELPSLDPFLLREHLRRRGFDISDSHFEISPSDLAMMQQFVATEISRLIDLAYGGRVRKDTNTARLVEALLSNRNDERLEPLRQTLRLEGDSYREGVFSWKGFLYYKWVLNSLWPRLKDVRQELMRVKLVGPRDRETEQLVRQLRARLHENIEVQVRAVSDLLRIYDKVFEELTKEGNATAFRDFLLKSPEMLVRLGEGAGVISHIASFWRFRFAKGKPLHAHASEFLDILLDFESGLGGETGGLSRAA
jgi:hypothetical protein